MLAAKGEIAADLPEAEVLAELDRLVKVHRHQVNPVVGEIYPVVIVKEGEAEEETAEAAEVVAVAGARHIIEKAAGPEKKIDNIFIRNGQRNKKRI